MDQAQFFIARRLLAGLDSAVAALYEDPSDLRLIGQLRGDVDELAELAGDEPSAAAMLRPLVRS